MSDEQPWRPLDVETDDEVAQYDALHDGLPAWIKTQFWEWVNAALTTHGRSTSGSTRLEIRTDLAEHAATALSIPMGTVRRHAGLSGAYSSNMTAARTALEKVPNPLNVADFLLAHSPQPHAERLNTALQRARSLWTVGVRNGRPGLVRRLPVTVEDQTERTVRGAGAAGVKLAQAWEAVYGVQPDPTKAYVLAIRAVEDAAIPVVVPKQNNPTLGHVQSQMKADGDWGLAFTRQPDKAPTPEGGLPLAMLAALWAGQHDRHGGEPSAPGNVSQQEAEAAVSLAVTLVQWFTTGMVARR